MIIWPRGVILYTILSYLCSNFFIDNDNGNNNNNNNSNNNSDAVTNNKKPRDSIEIRTDCCRYGQRIFFG